MDKQFKILIIIILPSVKRAWPKLVLTKNSLTSRDCSLGSFKIPFEELTHLSQCPFRFSKLTTSCLILFKF